MLLCKVACLDYQSHRLQVSDILSRDEIIIKSEEQVFEAVQRWVNYMCADSDISAGERQQACPRLLNHVRLPQLSPEYLMSKVCWAVSTSVL